MTLSELERLLENHAPGSLIPRDWLLDIVRDIDAADGAEDGLADLSINEAAEALNRSVSTVRAYCRSEFLPGAYRQQGREWRIPRSAIRAFQRAQAKPSPALPPVHGTASSVDLGAWKAEFDGEAA